MCACMYVCGSVFVCACVCMCEYAYIYIYVEMCVCVCVCVFTCGSVCLPFEFSQYIQNSPFSVHNPNRITQIT